MSNDKPNGWRKVPLSVIVIVVLNVGAMVWGASQLSSRLEATEKWIEENRATVRCVPLLEQELAHTNEVLREIREELRALRAERYRVERPGL